MFCNNLEKAKMRFLVSHGVEKLDLYPILLLRDFGSWAKSFLHCTRIKNVKMLLSLETPYNLFC